MQDETEIKIDPVTRVEGHGKITVELDEDGSAKKARFHVTQYRGFEKFCEGRPFWEMPSITARICGICSISHGIASAKACDGVMGVEITESAEKLRRLLQAGEIIQSHALHFFYLASPDLLFGLESDPATRNIVGVIDERPDLAKMGIGLRKFGQMIFQKLSGGRIHIDYPVAGGVNASMSEEGREYLRREVAKQIDSASAGLDLAKKYCLEGGKETKSFARFPSMYMGLVNSSGNLEFYEGNIRLKDTNGMLLEEAGSEEYDSVISEAVEDWSYLKFPYYSRRDYPDGMYRVGPLGRLNVCDGIDTPLASEALEEFRECGDDLPIDSTMFYHWARMIETLHFVEKVQQLLEDDAITGKDLVRTSKPRNREGIGVTEAPRGTLIHHYWTDCKGAIERINLIVATGHNNLAMNRSVTEIAKKYISDSQVPEGTLNKLEAAIRCYDPCLSCSTHAIGRMPLKLQTFDSRGNLVEQISR